MSLLSQKAFASSGCLRTPLTVEVVNVGSQRHFSLTQYKRLKQKSNWVSKTDPNVGPDADVLLPDRLELGNDPEINKAFHKYKIVPMQEAFRNLHLRGLLMLANGKTDKSKALHVPVANDDFTVYFGEKAPTFVPASQANVLPLDQYKTIVAEIKEHMSNTPSLVMHDGAIGSHPKCEVRARIITDDPTVGLYLHHVVPRVSIKGVSEFNHPVTAYVVSKFRPPALEAFGIKSERYILVDVQRGIVVIGGPISTAAIRAGLVAVAQPKLLVDSEGVPLDASIVGVQGSENPILVFGNHELAFDKNSGLEAHGTHNAAWTKDGLVRFFDGVTTSLAKDAPTAHGDFIEQVNGVARATTRKAATANIHAHPSAVVFLVNDSSNVLPTISKVSPDYVSEFMLAGFSGGKNFKPLYSSSLTADPHAVSATVGSLAKKHNANVYVVNLSSKDKPLSNDQIAKLLKAVASGSAKDAPVLSNVFSKISPLTSIKGLDLTLDPTKRGWDTNGLKTAATSFEKSISDFLSSTFPPPPPPSSAPPPSQPATPQK